jgi:hypothetical protein
MESIGELMVKLKGDVGGWQEGLFHWACSLAESTAKDLFDKIDQELMPSREKGLEIEGFKER